MGLHQLIRLVSCPRISSSCGAGSPPRMKKHFDPSLGSAPADVALVFAKLAVNGPDLRYASREGPRVGRFGGRLIKLKRRERRLGAANSKAAASSMRLAG